MKQKEFKRLLAEAKAKYDAARAEYEKTVEALQRVYALLHPEKADQGTAAGPRARRGALAKAIMEALGQVPADFTVNDVLGAIRAKAPELGAKQPSVSSFLRRLVMGGEISQVQKGKGQRPSVYRKTSSTQETEKQKH